MRSLACAAIDVVHATREVPLLARATCAPPAIRNGPCCFALPG